MLGTLFNGGANGVSGGDGVVDESSKTVICKSNTTETTEIPSENNIVMNPENGHSYITLTSQPGFCKITTTKAFDAPKIYSINSKGDFVYMDPRFNKHDLMGHIEYMAANGGLSIRQLTFDGKDCVHPIPVAKLYRPHPKGPIRWITSMPTSHSSHTKCGQYYDEYFKETEVSVVSYDTGGKEIKRTKERECTQKVDLRGLLGELSQYNDLLYIIPYSISMQVMQVSNFPPLQVFIQSPTALIETETKKSSKKYDESSSSSSSSNNVVHAEWARTNMGCINKRGVAERVYATVYSNGNNLDKYQTVYEIPKTLSEHSDFTRWMAIPPSTFGNEAKTQNVCAKSTIDIILTTGTRYQMDVLSVKVVDDPAKQSFTVWLWLLVRTEAVNYMVHKGLNEADKDTFLLGHIPQGDDSSSINTDEKDRELYIPFLLLNYYIGRYYETFDFNSLVLNTQKQSEVIIKPLKQSDLNETSSYYNARGIPSLHLEFTMYFDTLSKSLTGEDSKNFANEGNDLARYIRTYQKYNDGGALNMEFSQMFMQKSKEKHSKKNMDS